jgi:hypothetical protein
MSHILKHLSTLEKGNEAGLKGSRGNPMDERRNGVLVFMRPSEPQQKKPDRRWEKGDGRMTKNIKKHILI